MGQLSLFDCIAEAVPEVAAPKPALKVEVTVVPVPKPEPEVAVMRTPQPKFNRNLVSYLDTKASVLLKLMLTVQGSNRDSEYRRHEITRIFRQRRQVLAQIEIARYGPINLIPVQKSNISQIIDLCTLIKLWPD